MVSIGYVENTYPLENCMFYLGISYFTNISDNLQFSYTSVKGNKGVYSLLVTVCQDDNIMRVAP